MINASVTSYAYSDSGDTILRSFPLPDALPAPLRSEPPVPIRREYTVTQVMHHITSVTGIDVSHYQGNINWSDVAGDPKVRCVYIKATEGAGLKDS